MIDIDEYPKTAFYHALEDSGASVRSEVKQSVFGDEYYVAVRRATPDQFDAFADAGFTDITVIPRDDDTIQIYATVPEADPDD